MGIHSAEKHHCAIFLVCKPCRDMEAVPTANTLNINA